MGRAENCLLQLEITGLRVVPRASQDKSSPGLPDLCGGSLPQAAAWGQGVSFFLLAVTPRGLLCGKFCFPPDYGSQKCLLFFTLSLRQPVESRRRDFIASPILFFTTRFPTRPQRRSVSKMEKTVFPLRKCTVFIFRKNRLRPPLRGSWGRAAPKSCGRRLETGGAFLASFFRRRKKEGLKPSDVFPKRRTKTTPRVTK